MLSVEWKRFINWLLPWVLQQLRQNEWLQALSQPVVDVYDIFTAFKDKVLYDLSITGQVIYLEKMLNDKFNNSIAAWTWNAVTYIYEPNDTDGIYIIDFPNYIPVTYLWNKIELRTPLYVYNDSEAHTPPLYLYNKSEYDDEADFVVMIPIAVGDVATDAIFVSQVKAEINKYKQAGARYQIVNY